MDNTSLLSRQFIYCMLHIILLFTGLLIQTLLVKGLVGSLLSVQWLHCKGFFFTVELAMCKLSFLLFPSSCFPVSGNNLWFGNGNALVGFKLLKACHTRWVHWIHLICSPLAIHDQYLLLQRTIWLHSSYRTLQLYTESFFCKELTKHPSHFHPDLPQVFWEGFSRHQLKDRDPPQG